MPVNKKQHKSSQTSLDIANKFTLRAVMTPAMPSQRESFQYALRILAGIAVRMEQPEHPLPPRDLTCLPREAMNVEPLHEERSN